jgi:beta-glucosidase
MINDADAVIAVLGLSPYLEGENGDAYLSEAGGDKKDIRFPYAQLKYLRALRQKTKKPIIVVLTAGSAIELKEVEEIADAVVLAWYPGEQGGNAVADILFGKANPSGRLPITFYQSNNDLPAFENYSMQGRTYRYFNGAVTHPFGFGLSYTSFKYGPLTRINSTKEGTTFQFTLTNTGNQEGDEVVQLYLQRTDRTGDEPIKQLKSFKRVHLKPKETKLVRITLNEKDRLYWDEQTEKYWVIPGNYKVTIGSSSQDERLSYNIIQPK